MDSPDISYRLGVGMMVLNREKKVLVGQRRDSTDAWQMPQGGIDYGEAPQQAALRELREETSITSVQIVAESKDWLSYKIPENLNKSLWGGRFQAQKQKWFLFNFLGQDSEININTKHPEFIAWRWVEPHSILDFIVSFKHKLYQQILVEFAAYL